jgi:hypothetical protein
MCTVCRWKEFFSKEEFGDGKESGVHRFSENFGSSTYTKKISKLVMLREFFSLRARNATRMLYGIPAPRVLWKRSPCFKLSMKDDRQILLQGDRDKRRWLFNRVARVKRSMRHFRTYIASFYITTGHAEHLRLTNARFFTDLPAGC